MSQELADHCVKSDIEAIRNAIERGGADPNSIRPVSGVTPLHEAVVKTANECVSLLLDAGADPNVATKRDVETNAFKGSVHVFAETPLHL